MKVESNPVFKHFRQMLEMDQATLQQFLECVTKLEVPAKATLLKEGDIAGKLFFIERGCVRVFFNHAGKDLTFQFFFEQEAIASIESFKKQVPSQFSIETIEPCVLWVIHKNDLEAILNKVLDIPSMRNIYIDLLYHRTFAYMHHYLSFIKDPPQQRYLHLLKEKPQIALRVPQHYIASYLGISSVHLSRIKNKLAKNKFQ